MALPSKNPIVRPFQVAWEAAFGRHTTTSGDESRYIGKVLTWSKGLFTGKKEPPAEALIYRKGKIEDIETTWKEFIALKEELHNQFHQKFSSIKEVLILETAFRALCAYPIVVIDCHIYPPLSEENPKNPNPDPYFEKCVREVIVPIMNLLFQDIQPFTRIPKPSQVLGSAKNYRALTNTLNEQIKQIQEIARTTGNKTAEEVNGQIATLVRDLKVKISTVSADIKQQIAA